MSVERTQHAVTALAAALLLCAGGVASADISVVDFEEPAYTGLSGPNGFRQLTAADSAANGVDFLLGLSVPVINSDLERAWLHHVGGTQAFGTNDRQTDADYTPTYGGDQFISDGPNVTSDTPQNLYILFNSPQYLSSLSIAMYDYGDDNGAAGTLVDDDEATAHFEAYSGLWTNSMGSYTLQLDSLGITRNEEVEILSIDFAEPRWVRSASITFDEGDYDRGVGWDNLTYNCVPEPATMTLFGLGVAGLAARRFRRKRG